MKLYCNQLHGCNNSNSILEGFWKAFVHLSMTAVFIICMFKNLEHESLGLCGGYIHTPFVPLFVHNAYKKFPSEPIFFYSVIHLHQLPSHKLSTSVLAPPALVTNPYIYRCLTNGDGCIRWLLYSCGPLPPLWGIYGHLHASCPRREDGAKGPTF